MQTKSKQTKKTPFAFLIFSLMAYGGNIVINKTTVSPGSIVHGNTGIIIDGNKIEKGNISKKIEYIQRPIDKKIKKARIDLDGATIYLHDGNGTITFDKTLSLKITEDTLTLHTKNNPYYGSKVVLSDSNVDELSVKGDSVIKIEKKLSTLHIKGDTTLSIEHPQSDLSIEIEGDGNIYVKSKVDILQIFFKGDQNIEIEKANRVILRGKGDVIINIKDKNAKIVPNVKGDITIRRDND